MRFRPKTAGRGDGAGSIDTAGAGLGRCPRAAPCSRETHGRQFPVLCEAAFQGFHQIDDLGRFGDRTRRCRHQSICLRLDQLAARPDKLHPSPWRRTRPGDLHLRSGRLTSRPSWPASVCRTASALPSGLAQALDHVGMIFRPMPVYTLADKHVKRGRRSRLSVSAVGPPNGRAHRSSELHPTRPPQSELGCVC